MDRVSMQEAARLPSKVSKSRTKDWISNKVGLRTVPAGGIYSAASIAQGYVVQVFHIREMSSAAGHLADVEFHVLIGISLA